MSGQRPGLFSGGDHRHYGLPPDRILLTIGVEMNLLRAFLRNLFILAFVAIAAWVFMEIFYPEAFSFFPVMGQIYSGFTLWPILILGLLLLAAPQRRR
jgi:hypothetical protein